MYAMDYPYQFELYEVDATDDMAISDDEKKKLFQIECGASIFAAVGRVLFFGPGFGPSSDHASPLKGCLACTTFPPTIVITDSIRRIIGSGTVR